MKKIIVTVVCALALCGSVFAIDGRTVMQMAEDVKEPKFTHTLVQMDLVDKNGSVDSRQVEQWGRDRDGSSDIVMIFRNPASVRDTRFLQIENKGRDDDKWLYMPALRQTRRIAASEGDKSFMGTDATYDDMSGREVDDYEHELLKESEQKNGFTCWVVKSTPKPTTKSQYGYIVAYVDQATNVPVFSQMYDKKGALLKEMTVEKLQKVQGYDIPLANKLVNVQTGHSTRLEIKNIELDKPVPDKVFTQGFINTGRL